LIKPNEFREVAAQRLQRLAHEAFASTQKTGSVSAGLDDHQVGLTEQEQDAVGLNGAREMDLLALAIREIRAPKRWCRHGH
jgi:hypothetical protein